MTPESGWPVTTGFSVSPSATIAQLDADPQQEIIIASQDQKVYLYNHDGTLLPGWPKFIGNTLSPDEYAIINSSPAVADLSGDGDVEIVCGSNDGRMYVFNVNGSNEPGFPFNTGFMIFSTVAVGNIDGDSELEIVFGNNFGRIYAMNPNGTVCAGFPVVTPYAIRGSPALANLDEDPQLEIICPSEATAPDLYVLNGDGSNFPGWPKNVEPNLGLFSSPAVADVDLDGWPDIVVGLRNGQIAALDRFGNSMPGWPVSAGYSCLSSPTLVDLDDDPQLEIVVGMNDSKVVAYNHDGTLLPGWPVPTSYTVVSSPSVGDIDRDGEIEIVVGENTGKVYAFEVDGSAVAGFPLTSPTYTIYSSPLLADLDADGSLEILVGCNDTKIYAWDLGAESVDAELLPWPEWRGDDRNHANLIRPAFVENLGPPPPLNAGELIDLHLFVTSISQQSETFELWTRVFDEFGEVLDWPNAKPQALTLKPGEVATVTFDFAARCQYFSETYRAQVYLGEFGTSSFDTISFEVQVNAATEGDINCSGAVDVDDLLGVINAWGPCLPCPADVTGNGVVDVDDLLVVINTWS